MYLSLHLFGHEVFAIRAGRDKVDDSLLAAILAAGEDAPDEFVRLGCDLGLLQEDDTCDEDIEDEELRFGFQLPSGTARTGSPQHAHN